MSHSQVAKLQNKDKPKSKGLCSSWHALPAQSALQFALQYVLHFAFVHQQSQLAS